MAEESQILRLGDAVMDSIRRLNLEGTEIAVAPKATSLEVKKFEQLILKFPEEMLEVCHTQLETDLELLKKFESYLREVIRVVPDIHDRLELDTTKSFARERWEDFQDLPRKTELLTEVIERVVGILLTTTEIRTDVVFRGEILAQTRAIFEGIDALDSYRLTHEGIWKALWPRVLKTIREQYKRLPPR